MNSISLEPTFFNSVLAGLLIRNAKFLCVTQLAPTLVIVQRPWPEKRPEPIGVWYEVFYDPNDFPVITTLLGNFLSMPGLTANLGLPMEVLWEKACPTAFADLAEAIEYVSDALLVSHGTAEEATQAEPALIM